MNDLKKNNDGAIVLCCGGKGCPTLKVEDKKVTITDDFGGKIKMSVEEAKLIQTALQQSTD